MNKTDRMAHARAHKGGRTPTHKLTGPEALAKQIANSAAQREKEMRERAAAASDREVRAKETKKKQTREEQLEESFVKARAKRGLNPPWVFYTRAEWERLSREEQQKFNVAYTAEKANLFQLSSRVTKGRVGTIVRSSLSAPRRY